METKGAALGVEGLNRKVVETAIKVEMSERQRKATVAWTAVSQGTK